MTPQTDVLTRIQNRVAEGDSLVRSPLPTDFVQPWEVYDQELFDLEMVRVFGRSWVWLGDTEDLEEPGDFITGTIGYQRVVVIRQADGSLKGFLNNCRHRASGLAFEPAGNCGRTLTCPYHHWAYSIDGTLVGIPDKKRMYGDDFPMQDYGLVPIRVAVGWGKFVFGCLSRKAPSFEDWVGPLDERYQRYGFERYHRFHRELDEEYRFNWKLLVENANDDYHVRFVHRRNNPVAATMDTEPRWAGRTTSGYKPRKQHVDITGGRSDLPERDLRGSYADHIYPNLVPLPKQAHRPDNPRAHQDLAGVRPDPRHHEQNGHPTGAANQEDTDMITILMDRSPFYRAGPAATWEGRAIRLVRQDVETPLAPDEFEGADLASGRPIWAPSSGRRHLGAVIWAPSSGRRHLGAVIWAPSSGRRHLGAVIWAPSSGRRHLGAVILGAVIWAPSSGRRHLIWAPSSGAPHLGAVIR